MDSRIGGLGDVWMRLHALHAVSKLTTALRIHVAVVPALAEIAQRVFGERLTIATEPGRNSIVFSHRGLSDLAPRILRGERFNAAFRSTVRQDGPARSVRDLANDSLFELLSATGRVFLTDPSCVEHYSGWLQVSGLPHASRIPWNDARDQLQEDLLELRARLRAHVPERPDGDLVIFPSGTSFQAMPPEYAAEHFADAVFAFHVHDRYRERFAAPGLRVASFDSPTSLLALASRFHRVVATDSFPSHLLQTYSPRAIIALSHYPRRRIVHPGFDGQVVDSTAPCCPCLTVVRREGARCVAGRVDCLVWHDPAYAEKLRVALAHHVV